MTTSIHPLLLKLQNFHAEIDDLLSFDAENQKNFSTSSSSSGNSLRKRQLYMLTETVFFTAYRTYEMFMRDVFLSYCTGCTTRAGTAIVSYLKPKDERHAEELIKSSMPFLEWTHPDKIIARAEIYLQNGDPVKLPYTANKLILSDMKKIRNHIAHNSLESLDSYRKVIQRHFSILPLTIPSPGEFLLEVDKKNSKQYLLLNYLEFLKTISTDLT